MYNAVFYAHFYMHANITLNATFKSGLYTFMPLFAGLRGTICEISASAIFFDLKIYAQTNTLAQCVNEHGAAFDKIAALCGLSSRAELVTREHTEAYPEGV